MKKLIAFLLLVLFLTSANKLYSQDIDSLYDLNYSQYIANEIFNKRVVMIGEGIIHHHPISHYNLVNTLNSWVDRLRTDDKLNPNLVLIFETDSLHAELINKYIYSGDIKPLLDYVSPAFPLTDLEFYYELKKTAGIIKDINLSEKRNISFTVKGFEEIGYNIKDDYFRQTQKENELWFVNYRDSYTAKGIIRHLKENPGQKALIYYGSAHLQTGYSNKRLGGFSIPDEETMGYWLSQYLINEFGRDSLELFVSIGVRPGTLDNTPFEHLKEKAFVLTKRQDTFRSWFLTGINKYIVNPYLEIPIYELNYSLSRFIVEKSIEKAAKFEKLLPGYKAGTGTMPLYYLYQITGKYFRNSDTLKNWYSKGEFKGFKTLDSKEFYDNVFLYYLKYAAGGRSKQLFLQFGFPDNILQYESTSEIMWKERMWKQALPDIKIMNAIGIYWAGYPDEKAEAKKYLKIATGKDFEEPAEYLQWWRREYRKYGK